jgi:hypothetical protein
MGGSTFIRYQSNEITQRKSHFTEPVPSPKFFSAYKLIKKTVIEISEKPLAIIIHKKKTKKKHTNRS